MSNINLQKLEFNFFSSLKNNYKSIQNINDIVNLIPAENLQEEFANNFNLFSFF